MKFANLLPWVQVLLSSTCAFGQQYVPIHGPLDKTLRVVASATVSERYYPFDLDPTKVLSRNRSEAWDAHLTSSWNTTVTVGDDDGAFKSLLSLSWPEKEGPTSGPVSNSYGWGACVVAMPGLLDVLHVTGHSNVSCLGTISKLCRDSLMADLLDNFDYPLLDDSGARVNNATAQCEALSRVQLSLECFGGGDGPGTPFQGLIFPKKIRLHGNSATNTSDQLIRVSIQQMDSPSFSASTTTPVPRLTALKTR